MYDYYNTCIYYFIKSISLSLISGCSPFFSFFLSFVSASFFFSLLLLSLTLAVLITSLTDFVLTVLVTGAVGFVGTDVSMALKLSRRWGFGSRQLQWVLNGSIHRGGGDERVGWEICHSRSWWFMWWWWWRWEDLRKFCLIYLKFELFGLWENLGKCLVHEKIWESENEMLFGCFVVILLWNGGL